MNAEKISLECLNKINEIRDLSKKTIELYRDLRECLLYRAINKKIVSLEVERRKTNRNVNMPKGARVRWPNGDTLLLTLEEYRRCAYDNSIAGRTAFEMNIMEKHWNKCFSE